MRAKLGPGRAAPRRRGARSRPRVARGVARTGDGAAGRGKSRRGSGPRPLRGGVGRGDGRPVRALSASTDRGRAGLENELGLPGHLTGFLAHAGLRPALEVWFSRVRALPASGWERGFCPWCGGMPSYGDLMEDGRRRLSCHLCGGAWIGRAPSLSLLPGATVERHGAAGRRGRGGGLLHRGVSRVPRLSQGPRPPRAMERSLAARGRLGLAPSRLLRGP